MSATITSGAATTLGTTFSSIQQSCRDIGLSDAMLVYSATAEGIYKITNGTGTYADTYIRIFYSSTWQMTVGTGFSVNAISGAGTAYPIFGTSSVGTTYNQANVVTKTTILSSDSTYAMCLYYNSSGALIGGFGYVKPTNTTLTASTIPLTYGLVASGTFSCTSPAGTGNQSDVLFDASLTPFYTYNIARYVISNKYYGTETTNMGFGCSLNNGISATGGTSSFRVAINYAYSFGLHKSISGNYPVLPNVPIMSGGTVIGYNSNLAYGNPRFNPGDRIVISAGVEEYVMVDSAGVYVRSI